LTVSSVDVGKRTIRNFDATSLTSRMIVVITGSFKVCKLVVASLDKEFTFDDARGAGRDIDPSTDGGALAMVNVGDEDENEARVEAAGTWRNHASLSFKLLIHFSSISLHLNKEICFTVECLSSFSLQVYC
jgi:hypothetical protein